MSSSDSEDDCYGNIAQKLKSLKNTYKEDKVEITNLLDDSTDNVQTKKVPPTFTESFAGVVDTSVNSTDNDELTLDAIIANNSKKRATRSSKRKATEKSSEKSETAKTTGGKRGRGRKTATSTAGNTTTMGRGRKTVTPSAENTSGRGRGRSSNTSNSRGSSAPLNSRGRRDIANFFNIPSLPVYSVGNTDEYPDQCDNQQLFTTSSEVVVIEENDPLDDNEELSVKVYWQSSEFFKFTIRRYQKLTQIFEHFSKKENVSYDKLFFTYNDRILKVDDSPDSIDYNIVKFIDGGIVNNSVSQIVTKDKNVKDGIKIKFQCQNVKKPYETIIRPDDKLLVAMMMCAEHLELPLNRLKFKFDGDTLPGKNTARELDLEGGECIDVEIMS